MPVDVGELVLAAAAAIVEARRRRGEGAEYVTLYDLNKVLSRVAGLYEERTGEKFPLKFVEYSFGPYSPDLEAVLERLAEEGHAEYVVRVHVPAAPSGAGVDEDYAWAVVEHQLSERDSDRKYVRKLFKPRRVPRLPEHLAELVREAAEEYVAGKGG